MMQPQQQQVVVSHGGVVQPAAVVTQPVTVMQPTYITQQAPIVERYAYRQSTVIGILLIIAGALSIVFNIVDLAVGTKIAGTYSSYGYPNYYYESLSVTSKGVAGHGLWCGALVIIAGGFGIGAGRHRTSCMIVTFMVMAIIGAVFAFIQVCVAGDGAGNIHRVYDRYLDADCGDSRCKKVTAVYAMEVLLAIFGAAEFVLCLWGSILTCVTGNCCRQRTVVAYQATQPQVTVVTQQQQQHPMQPMQPVPMASPPAAYPPAYPQAQMYPPQQQQPYPGYTTGPPPAQW